MRKEKCGITVRTQRHDACAASFIAFATFILFRTPPIKDVLALLVSIIGPLNEDIL